MYYSKTFFLTSWICSREASQQLYSLGIFKKRQIEYMYCLPEKYLTLIIFQAFDKIFFYLIVSFLIHFYVSILFVKKFVPLRFRLNALFEVCENTLVVTRASTLATNNEI